MTEPSSPEEIAKLFIDYYSETDRAGILARHYLLLKKRNENLEKELAWWVNRHAPK